MKHLDLLGYQVRDVVSGFEGVVTSISFDLYGCVQGLVTPPVTEKEGKKSGDSWWFDTKRLVRVAGAEAPVMPVPDFAIVPGGQDLPHFASQPNQ